MASTDLFTAPAVHAGTALPWSNALLPIVIGVTGHRDLRPGDEPRLEQAVAGILNDLATRHPFSPLVLLSPLAEGADRLVARVFLGRAEKDPRHRLVVPLPMSADEYMEDFTYPASRSELDELLEHAEIVQIPRLPTPCDSPAARNDAYARVGAFIARHSQILIALWNGAERGEPGGTAEIVRFRLEGVPHMYLPHADPLDPPEHGPVYHVMAPRRQDRERVQSAGTVRLIFPPAWPDSDQPRLALAVMLEQLESFNADATRFLKLWPDQVQASMTNLVGDEEVTHGLSASETHLMRAYAIADALAVHHQRITHRTVRGLLQLAVVAVFVNQLYSNLLNQRRVGLLYLIILLAGAAGLWIANRFNWQQKHFNYRALAEGLRVQLFWRVAGIEASAADSYLRAQREDLHGVRLALRFFELSFHADRSSGAGAERLRFVHERWIRAQRHYFLGEAGAHEGAVARDRVRARRVGSVAQACFLAATLLLVVIVLWHNTLQQVREMLLAASATFLGIAAAAIGYAKVMGFGEHVRHGEKVGELFLRAERQLLRALEQPGAHDAGDVRKVLLDIGREALAENAEWVILHRSRPWEFSVS